MSIEFFDSPQVIALKQKLAALEHENQMLRNTRGVWPHNQVLTQSLYDMPSASIDLNYVRFEQLASWDIKLCPFTGKAHAWGKAIARRPMETSLEVKYYTQLDDTSIRSKSEIANLMDFLHKKVLLDLASELNNEGTQP